MQMKNIRANKAFKYVFMFFFFLSFFVNHAFSCIDSGINLLAVDSKSGSAADIPFLVRVINNNGNDIFVNIANISYDDNLQQSIANAYKIASSKANKNCSVVVLFPTRSKELAGPSGGLGIALAFYKSFSESNINIDEYGITGALDEQGNVLPVGGILEKVEAAIKSGKKKVIIPITDRFDYIMLKYLYPDIKVYYVLNFDQALSVINNNAGNVSAEQFLFFDLAKDRAMLNSLKQSSYKYDFAIYYERLKEDYNVTLQHLRNKIDKNAYDYYENILSYAEQLKDKGYYYSASNTLFTNAVELMSFDAIINNRDVKKEAEQCINEAKSLKVESNKNNFELISGALFRLARAEERLIRKVEDNTKSAKAYLAKAHAESLEWCKFSSSLLNNAMSINGDKINEEAIKDYAVNYILSVDENSLTDEEKEFYMLGLKYAAKQDFITSAFYVAYLNSSLSSVQYKGQKLDGFWANVFASQAEYLYSISGNTASASSSFALALSFNNIYNLVTQSTVLEDTGLENINKGGNKTSIENISEEKLNESTNKSVNESSNEIKAKGQEENAASIALSLSLFIIAIILLYLLTKYYGNQEKRKKARYKYERR